jgi:aryl-alcohol dehydrogenase-like predicted oxidoreductase
MLYRRFGRTDLNVSILGLGSGGPSQLGQKSGVGEAEVRAVVRGALDLGINLIDTAAAYGESEAILGRALQGVPRDDYVLATKFSPAGRNREVPEAGYVFRTEQDLIESTERSLTRLGTDHVDVLQLHAVTPETYAHAREVMVPALLKLKEQGKTRFIGLTESFEVQDNQQALQLALADDVFDTLLVGYNLLTPGPEDRVLPLAAKQDVGVMVMCAVRRRIAKPEALTALVRDLKARGELPETVDEDRPLDWLLQDGAESVTEAAYRYVAGNTAVASVLTGTANLEHLKANVAAVLKGDLPAADRSRLRALFGPVGRKLGD